MHPPDPPRSPISQRPRRSPVGDAVRRVVIVDDDEAVRTALVELLSDEACLAVVGTGGDADEAIALCREHEPDVLLVDVNMPGGGGERAAEIVTRELPRTVVVALSANADRATRRRMLAAGAVVLVAKGRGDELLAAVTTATVPNE